MHTVRPLLLASMLSFSLFADTAHACDVPDAPRLARPIAAAMTAGFGIRKHPILGIDRMHEGADFPAPMGAAVAAAAAGRVATAGHSGEYGNLVVLEHGSGLATSYAHLLHIAVAEGDCIAAGQIVGQVGATGLAAQPLLHFEVRRNGTAVDPASLIPELR